MPIYCGPDALTWYRKALVELCSDAEGFLILPQFYRLLLILTVLAVLPTVAYPQSSGNLAVLNVQKIYRDAVAAVKLREDIDVGREKARAGLAAKEKKLLEADQALKQQRAILSADAFAKKSQDIGNQVTELQRDVANQRKANEEKYARGIAEIQKAVVVIVSEIADERKLDIVLTSSAVVLQSMAIEITDETMKRLNERLPQVKGQ